MLGRNHYVVNRPAVLVFLEVFKPIRSHFGVSHGVHNIFVAHVVLERSCVMAIVGELVAGRMPQHVRMDGEWEFRAYSSPGDHLVGSVQQAEWHVEAQRLGGLEVDDELKFRSLYDR